MKMNKILIVTAVDAEREAVLNGLNGNSRFHVIAGGVGPILAAINTTKALMNSSYDLVISAGIGGGFSDQAEISSVVVATDIVSSELGAETADGFVPIEHLGFGCSKLTCNPELVEKVVHALKRTNLSINQGPIVTVCTVTGTKKTTEEIACLIPNVAAEAMEGFGVASAANEANIPFIELRTISNPVGPRDRDAWKLKEALETLEKVSLILPEVFS